MGGNPLRWTDPTGEAIAIPAVCLASPVNATACAAAIAAAGKIVLDSCTAAYEFTIDYFRSSANENEDDCRKEKEAAIELCADIAETNDSDRKHVWGGSFSQCIKNVLPARCGGEGLWKGF